MQIIQPSTLALGTGRLRPNPAETIRLHRPPAALEHSGPPAPRGGNDERKAGPLSAVGLHILEGKAKVLREFHSGTQESTHEDL